MATLQFPWQRGMRLMPIVPKNLHTKCGLNMTQGKSAIAAAGEFELMFTNTEVQKIVRISKTNQDNSNL